MIEYKNMEEILSLISKLAKGDRVPKSIDMDWKKEIKEISTNMSALVTKETIFLPTLKIVYF